MSRPETILVAVDFSEPSKQALETAIELARREGAVLHIAHALELPTPIFTTYAFEMPEAYLTSAREESQRLLQEAVDEAGRRGVEAKSHLLNAPAAMAIEEMAREVDADLVVVGTHGHTGLRHLALGSVAERVIRHAPCNVLVVKHVPSGDDGRD